jgi:hypothetical protein
MRAALASSTTPEAVGGPLRGLTTSELRRFTAGQEAFEEVEDVTDGLGRCSVTTYLHDGRAATLEDAIRAHDGQGRGARDWFVAVGSLEQELLLAFLKTL